MHREDLLEVDLGPRARGYFTTRGAGARPVTPQEPYAGANLALHVGDDPARVGALRCRLEELVGAARRADGRSAVAWMNQVHSALVAPADTGAEPTADALVLDARTAGPGPAAVGVLVADCVPLLLASHDGALVAAVHAGRRGMLDGVVGAALEVLAALGAEPADLWAATGPSICGRCYEVPETLHRSSAQIEPACASTTRWGTPGLDVAAGVLAQLRRAGVGRVAASTWCTYEDERFYSYRRQAVTGRLAGVVIART
ncbi:MAG: polyphenol oxidase family protein [Actinomyces sp.]|uniref:polyphenol oxidase family protein n=1 Tax=Actinomyces sp. TaxID=29317 RepID=UPI0026DB67EF|nr:polyphenol oxidase family protein [Actinomyces sp.]MDO4243902.1 polyphenol oxidase family protein [Actinomyces sp.]